MGGNGQGRERDTDDPHLPNALDRFVEVAAKALARRWLTEHGYDADELLRGLPKSPITSAREE